jgi:hypothetical protein
MTAELFKEIAIKISTELQNSGRDNEEFYFQWGVVKPLTCDKCKVEGVIYYLLKIMPVDFYTNKKAIDIVANSPSVKLCKDCKKSVKVVQKDLWNK